MKMEESRLFKVPGYSELQSFPGQLIFLKHPAEKTGWIATIIPVNSVLAASNCTVFFAIFF